MNDLTEEFLLEQKKEKRTLSLLSNFGALTILSFSFIGVLISLGLTYFPTFSAYCRSNYNFYLCFDILCSFVYLFLPFLALFFIERTVTPQKFDLPLSFPKQKGRAAILVFACIALCVAGSYITNYVVLFTEDITGVEFLYETYNTPAANNFFGRGAYIIRMAIFPAIVEEFAMRGVIMTPLRRYGDKFAILMTSLMFGLMHGNLVQLPFAFMAGFALAYAVIQTNSLWTSIFIHLANNMLSVIQMFIVEDYGEESTLILIPVVAVFIIGITCIIIWVKLMPKWKLRQSNALTLKGSTIYGKYLFSPGMIIAILYMLSQSLLATDKGSELMARFFG